MKKTIVIGGAGFIGTNLCLSALRKKLKVVIFDNFSRKGTELNLRTIQKESPQGLEVIKGDIRSVENLEELFDKHPDADVIFHQAAQVAVTDSIRNPRKDFEVNAVGTFNVLETMRQKRIDSLLLYSSTNKVYGNLEGEEILEEPARYSLKNLPQGINEAFPLDFHSPYGCSKGSAEQYVIDYARIYGLKTMVFRQSCIYGYHQFGIEDQGWVAWFTIAALFDFPITLFGDGKQVRDVLFIDDLIEVYWMAVSDPTLQCGEVFNIGGGGYQSSLVELIDHLENIYSKKIRVDFKEPRPGDQLVYVSDIKKAKEKLQWNPKIDVENGVKKLAAWAMKNKNLFLQAKIVKNSS